MGVLPGSQKHCRMDVARESVLSHRHHRERVAGYFGMYDNDLDTAAAVDAKIANGTRWEQYNLRGALRIIKACNE